MRTIEEYFLAFWRRLNDALRLRGLAEATAGQADRCYRLGLSASESVTILAMTQPKRQGAAA